MGKIIFIVQHLGQPRCVKRIISLKEAGFDVEVYGFDQGNYSENICLLSEKDIPVKKALVTRGKSKIQKILAYVKLVRYVSQKVSKEDVVYAFGFELATAVRCFTRSRYIYECADVVAAREHSSFMKHLDITTIKKSSLTVLTSEGFADFFWGECRKNDTIRNKYILQPNKLSSYFSRIERPAATKLSGNTIRFGFVGLFRFLEIYLTFCEIIGKEYPNYEFHFWGDSNDADKEKVREITERYPNIYNHGAFINPNDLKKVYESIDVCVTCYNTTSGNVKIAEPNKLYESMYFCKPIIVSRGTFLGKKVEHLKVGKSIIPTSEGIKDFLKTISIEELNKMIDCEARMDEKELIDNPDELCRRLTSIMNLK